MALATNDFHLQTEAGLRRICVRSSINSLTIHSSQIMKALLPAAVSLIESYLPAPASRTDLTLAASALYITHSDQIIKKNKGTLK